MEKVRKAEVKPPSEYNRRVPEQLDKISLRALARNVADRYQTAAELAEELYAVLEGYRFQRKELEQFLRQEFRVEFAQERADQEIARSSLPPSDLQVPEREYSPPVPVDTVDEPVPAALRTPATAPLPHGEAPGAEPEGGGGLFGRWRRKKK
jgi:hypothetical protein